MALFQFQIPAMPPVTVAQAFDLAVEHHKAGRLAEAEAIYRQILAVQPNHSDALHLLGMIGNRFGHHELAVKCIQRALVLDPNNAAAHSNLGEVYRLTGRFDEAMASYRRAIAINPNLPEAHSNLGIILRDQGQFEEALAMCRRALALKPDFAEAHNNLGNTLQDKGQLEEAVAAFRRALELNPEYAEAHTNLGNALQELQRPDEAVAAYHRALELQPNSAESHNNLGAALVKKGQLDDAVAAVRRALELKPDYAGAYYNLGIVLRLQGQFDEAIAAYHRALALKPDDAEVHNDLGVVLAESGQLDAAAASCRRAVELDPDSTKACNNLGHVLTDLGQFDAAFAMFRQALQLTPNFADSTFGEALLRLLRGDFEQGWPLYEVRWEVYRSEKRDFSQPMWDGASIAGRRLLIHAEQGLGDSIQFIRYAALADARGAQVVVECSRSVVELFRGVKGVAEAVTKGDPLPPFDLHVPMLSQPLVFQTRRETIPREVPYLFANPDRAAIWKDRLGGDRSRLRVGLAWAGNPQHRRMRIRDVSFELLRPLWRLEGIDFFSLQIGPAAEKIRQLVDVAAINDHTEHIQTFADTAALMLELDLIISVDTAVAHLAGALGRPVWTLLPFVPDWRWGLEGDQTPWYPTMRLFRQPSPGDWDSVLRRVADELRRARQFGTLAWRDPVPENV